MSSTRLSDLLLPTSFSDYTVALTMEKSALIQSGVAVVNPDAVRTLATGPRAFTLRQYDDLDASDDKILNDDPSDSLDEADFDAIGTVEMRAILHERGKFYSEQDLAVELNGNDPIGSLANRIAKVWARRHQAATISSLVGVIAAGEAAAAGTYSFVSGATDAELNSNAIIKAWNLIGDASADLVAIAMHSQCYHRLQQLNLISFIPNSRGEIVMPVYLGLSVIVDDAMPIDAVPTPDQYSLYLLGAGAIQTAIGTGVGLLPDEIFRDPKSGNGAGRTDWYSRRRFTTHPFGFSYTGTTDGDKPTNTQLETATNWSVAATERKQIPLVELKAAATLAD